MERLMMAITGMRCGHCVQEVTKALRQLDEVQVQDVRVGQATVLYDPASISGDQIVQAVNSLGYEAQAAGRAA